MANLAILYQRLGRYQQALDLYLSLEAPSADIPASQRAQVLANKGTLYRRLGDPYKALEAYRTAGELFAREHHPFGEVGVLKNIGIALALDLHRMPEALDAFAKASRLAGSSAVSQLPSTLLYRAEAFRLAGRMDEARQQFAAALESARKQGSKEYAWRALFGLGQVAEHDAKKEEALTLYLESIKTFESLRSGLDMRVLKRDFQADKREVYDASIRLLLNKDDAQPEQLFELMENSRSRILQDSLGEERAGLRAVQAKLGDGVVLLEFWDGPEGGAALSVTRDAAHIVKHPAVDVSELRSALMDANRKDWRLPANRLGAALLSDPSSLQSARSVIVVPDGALGLIPFEVLQAAGQTLMERAPVFYLPSAGVLLRREWGASQAWRMPWQKQVAAFADPAVDLQASAVVDSSGPTYGKLVHAEEEARYVTASAIGRSEVHAGKDATKHTLLEALSQGFATLHISSHATVDSNDPERSRILLAPPNANEHADFLFLREVYSLNLRPVDLVVLSACDTETGKVVRGEGVEGFSKALITAGAASAVTTLWRVDDAATAQFMKQFYYQLSSGKSKAEALRQAKLKLMQSGSALAHPAYWAAFVLNGDGMRPAVRFVSWWMVTGAALLALCALAITVRSIRSNR